MAMSECQSEQNLSLALRDDCRPGEIRHLTSARSSTINFHLLTCTYSISSGGGIYTKQNGY